MSANPSDIRELHAGETELAHRALAALRPAFAERSAFVEHVDRVLRPGGYRLLGAFTASSRDAISVAGFRTGHCLGWGYHLYVDDLSTLPDGRRQGHAGKLLDWLVEEARRLGCKQLHLDSGTGPDRFDAHRFYHRHGLVISSHHFARQI
jgi:GNAT superfamily N-acetyltransferase